MYIKGDESKDSSVKVGALIGFIAGFGFDVYMLVIMVKYCMILRRNDTLKK